MSSTPPTHVDLVSAIADRDRASFASLFQIFAPRIKGYLMRSIRDQSRTDELTQEVMLRVWRKAHTFDARRGSVATWIFTISRSVMLDALRRARRPEPHPDDLAFVPAAAPQPDDATDLLNQKRSVRAALETLPTEQAAILRAAYFEGKTLRQISEEQDLALGTVKSRVRLAFGHLRNQLPEPS